MLPLKYHHIVKFSFRTYLGSVTQSCDYSKRYKGMREKPETVRSVLKSCKTNLEEDARLHEELENQQGHFEHTLDNPALAEQVFKEEENRRRIVKYKMMERKYFKKPQEKNLLTWDAKEQIRFLYNNYANEWTVERLAESYPISREGVIKLLKSTWVPKTFDEIIKHDERVKKNWEELKSEKGVEGGPVHNPYQVLKSEGKLFSLANATGITSLPRPSAGTLLPAQFTPVKTKTGVYESIVKGYYEGKQKSQGHKDEEKSQLELLKEHQLKSQKYLEGITSAIVPRSGKSGTKDLKIKTEKTKSVQYGTPVDYSSFTSPHDNKEMEKTHENSIKEFVSMLDGTMADDFGKQITRRRVRRGISQEPNRGMTSKEKVDNVTDLQVKGTGKVDQKESGINKMCLSDEYSYLEGNELEKFEFDQEDSKIINKMQYDPDGEATYIYDEIHGYQYPLGKVDKSLEKVEIPQSEKGKDKLFKKDNNYYDEDGEFLFRIPWER